MAREPDVSEIVKLVRGDTLLLSHWRQLRSVLCNVLLIFLVEVMRHCHSPQLG